MSRNDSMETELGGLNVFSRTRSYSKAINKAVKSLRYCRAGSQWIPSAIPDRTSVFGCGFLYRVPLLRSLATFSRPTTPWTCGASTTPAVVHWRNTMDDIMKSSDAWWDLDQLLRVFAMVRKVIGPFGWDRSKKKLTALITQSCWNCFWKMCFMVPTIQINETPSWVLSQSSPRLYYMASIPTSFPTSWNKQ